MKLHIRRSQTESTGFLGGKKKYTYSLKITVSLSDEELQLLSKYDYLSENLIDIDSELAKEIRISMKGTDKVNINLLQKGLEWSVEGYLSGYLRAIPSEIASNMKDILVRAEMRELWNCEEVVDIHT